MQELRQLAPAGMTARQVEEWAGPRVEHPRDASIRSSDQWMGRHAQTLRMEGPPIRRLFTKRNAVRILSTVKLSREGRSSPRLSGLDWRATMPSSTVQPQVGDAEWRQRVDLAA